MLKIFLLSFIAFLSPAQSSFPSTSLYQIGSPWIDQNGEKRGFPTFQNHYVILSMVYLSCKYSCPLTVQRMKDFEKMLPLAIQSQTYFVLASFDPKNDSPPKLKKQMQIHKLDPSRWTLLTSATEKEPRELASALEFQYQKMENGEFTHSFKIVVLDKDGTVMGSLERADQETTLLKKILSREAP
jgi:protein SCO1/2